MPSIPGSLKYRDFIQKLTPFGVVEDPKRGKGSEKYLVRESIPGTMKGPSTSVRCHGKGDEIMIGSIKACLRRLGIKSEDFWG